MKILITYYSRSGKTEKIAEQVALKINAELQKISDQKNRAGIFGFISSGNEAYLKQTTTIDKLEKDPANFDLIIIGTPVWAGNVSSPVRSFLKEYNSKFKKVAFFCTSMGSDPGPIFSAMEKLATQKPLAVMNVTARDMKKHFQKELIADFVALIGKQSNDGYI